MSLLLPILVMVDSKLLVVVMAEAVDCKEGIVVVTDGNDIIVDEALLTK